MNVSELISTIKEKLKIVEVVSAYVDLEKTNKNYKGICPFCKRTEGFSVSPQKNLAKCFVCGTGGQVVTFISEIEGYQFLDTLKFIVNKFHNTLGIKESDVDFPKQSN